jgi:hypothetical protein
MLKFLSKKSNQDKKRRAFWFFKFQMALAQLCKNTFACLSRHPNISTPKGGIDSHSVGCNNSILWLEPHQKQQTLWWHMDL